MDGDTILLPAGGVVGKPEDRVDGPLKVTGRARYSAEMPVHGVLYGAMVMSTIARGEIVAMDTGAASSQPHVRLVLTPFNAPKLPNDPSPGGNAPGRGLQVLQNTTVYYNNQPIALVVADTFEAARAAGQLVRVTYRQDPATTHMDSAPHVYRPDSAHRHDTDSSRGDVEGSMASASHRMTQLYTTPIENHNPMEPHATLAVWQSPTHLTVYDSTQGIFGCRGTLANIWGLPEDNVRVVCYFIGGGFGCKGSVWSHVPLATMAAKAVGRPVKVVLERHQMYMPVGYRPLTRQTISLGADSSGKLVAASHDVVSQSASFDWFAEPAAGVTRMLYACPNLTTTHRIAKLDYGAATWTRAPGESTGTYALESAMDEMALQAGMDPVEFRLANYADSDPQSGRPWSSKSLKECYRIGAERIGWSARDGRPRSQRTPDGQLIGYGMATATYPTGWSRAHARARVLRDGRAIVESGSQDLGTGTYTVMRQVAADALGVPYGQVTFDLGSTTMPDSPGSGGSQTAASVGTAVLDAGLAVRRQAIAAAVADPQSPLHGLDPSDIDVREGALFARSRPSVRDSYAAILGRSKQPSFDQTVAGQRGADVDQYAMHSFGAVYCVVHVDPDLGAVRVAKTVGVYGVGRRLNEKTARSQLMGGIVWGIGMALMEATLVDPRTGRVLNPDLAEYHVPTNADVREIDVVFVDEDDPHVNPLGIKGIGELGITGTAGAIVNAVYNATGIRVRDLPVTLDKLLA